MDCAREMRGIFSMAMASIPNTGEGLECISAVMQVDVADQQAAPGHQGDLPGVRTAHLEDDLASEGALPVGN